MPQMHVILFKVVKPRFPTSAGHAGTIRHCDGQQREQVQALAGGVVDQHVPLPLAALPEKCEVHRVGAAFGDAQSHAHACAALRVGQGAPEGLQGEA